MTLPYNFTQVSNQTTLPDLLITMNSSIGEGWIGTILLVVFFIILLVSFKAFDGMQAFAASSIIIAVMAIFMSLLGIISTLVLVIFMVLASVGAVILLFRG